MTLQKLFKFPWVSAVCGVLCLSSCGNGCEETRETFCVASLYAETGLSISTLYAWGIGQQRVADTLSATGYSDSLMLEVSSPEQLEFILQPDTTVTRIRLQMTVTGDSTYQVEDTLTIRYDARPVFLNMDCGCTVFFTIREVNTTGHLLLGTSIEKAEITNTEDVNISLLY